MTDNAMTNLTSTAINDNQRLRLYQDYLNDGLGAALHVFEYLTYCLLCLGFIGNALCLFVFHKRNRFGNAHFAWYKAIAWADMLYCINLALEIVVEACVSVTLDAEPQQVYLNRAAAEYIAHVCGLVSSGTTYWVMYLTGLATAERFAASCLSAFYARRFRNLKRSTALLIIVTCALVAFAINSWAFAIHIKVEWFMVEGITYYYHTGITMTGPLKMADQLKDFYNLVINVAHAIILLVCSVGMFCVRPRYRSEVVQERAKARECALNWLMGVVVGLQLLRTVVREIRRVLEFFYPNSTMNTLFDLPFAEGVHLLRVVYFGHYWLVFISNCVILIERTCKCYIYLISRRFRRALLDTLRMCVQRRDREWNSS